MTERVAATVADMTAAESDPPTRLDRRKARTRRALVEAARDLLVERGTDDVSIQEITDRADVGFGSFYNHFTTKAELFEAAVTEALDEHGSRLDEVTAGVQDPAEAFAVSYRTTARLADDQPAMARILVQIGTRYLAESHGLAPRALRDIDRAVAAGRFHVANAHLALAGAAGCMLSYLQLRLERPELLGPTAPEDLTEQVLRMLGMSARSARAVAHRPLPPAAGN